MRVASRRVREALRLFAPLYGRRTLQGWNDATAAVTRALGAVRDDDVFIAAFARLARDADTAEERTALAWLVGVAQGERSERLRRMRKRLAGLDLGGLRAGLKKTARTRAVPEADLPLSALATRAVAERLDAVAALLPAARNESDSASQHALRIAMKRLRYAVETLAPCFDDGFPELHRTLVAFQDALGELHDSDVFLARVREAAKRGDAKAAGVSAAGLAQVVAGLEAARAKRFRRFRRLLSAHPEPRLRAALLAAIVPVDDSEATA
jgi:CHAD domain-containing protein